MELLEILNELYEDGVDYVDISGIPSNDLKHPQDLIKITVRPDYISQDDTEDIDESSISVSKLSDNDINDLI